MRNRRASLAFLFALVNASFAWITRNSGSFRTSAGAVTPIASASETLPSFISHSTCASPLSLNVQELATIVNGKGRAQAVWDCYRNGIDPLDESQHVGADDTATSQLSEFETAASRSHQTLGTKALRLLRSEFGGSVRERVAETMAKSVAEDGTTKLLLQLKCDNFLQVETVIIPWTKRQRSTLCVSSQVGCAQACTFCMTGRMGKLRSLTADEILAQVFHAVAVCQSDGIYPIDNVVFMGMGDSADNAAEVVRAASILADSHCFQFASQRVTISTVAPSPESFQELGQAPAVLAWSVHSSRDEIRKQLVPTTRYSMVDLREGFIQALLQRSRRKRAAMLEITLLDGVNDSVDDALHLADFCQPLLRRVPGIKLVVNLIPWNDISAAFGPASHYRKPSSERVLAFQNVLVEHGILCFTRITRGDDENAACGQLATRVRQPLTT